MRRREAVRRAYWLVAAIFLVPLTHASPAQETRGMNCLAQHYEVSAYLDTTGQTINSIAKVEFRAQEASQVVRVELHQNMEVREVKGPDGKPLSVQRDNEDPLAVTVTLPTPVAVGKTVTLTFAYGGVLASGEKNPLAQVGGCSLSKQWA